MYKVYFKQAIQMLRQNKFISIISILGMALAIMMIMTIIVSYEVKVLSINPEPNRSRTLYVDQQLVRSENGGESGGVPGKIVRNYFHKMTVPEMVSAINRVESQVAVKNVGGEEVLFPAIIRTDNNYWNILSFKFMDGRAFSSEEFESGVKNAVISEELAKKLFKNESAVNKNIEINFAEFKVVGVVKDVSPVFTDAYAQVWVPFSALSVWGDYKLLFLAKDKNDYTAIGDEVRAIEKQLNAENAPDIYKYGGPDTKWVSQATAIAWLGEERADTIKKQNRMIAVTLLILLLIPAINLSGFSMSRMNKRMGEIGIRKSFGAKRSVILIQVLYENMITSIIGGVIGLLLSYFIIYKYRYWLLGIPEDSYIPMNALVSVPILLIVFCVCLLLNILSAGIPAYRASRMSIIDSLNQR